MRTVLYARMSTGDKDQEYTLGTPHIFASFLRLPSDGPRLCPNPAPPPTTLVPTEKDG